MQGSGPPQPQPPCAGRRTARPAGRRPWSPSRPRGMTAQWRTSSAAACGPESDGRRGRPLQPWSGAHTRTLISRGLTATFGRLMALDASPKLVQKGGSPSRARAGVRPCRALPPALLRFFEHWIPEASRIQKASNIAKNGAIAPFQHFDIMSCPVAPSACYFIALRSQRRQGPKLMEPRFIVERDLAVCGTLAHELRM